MRRFSMFLAGTICGAAVGAITALLLAPTSGEELRNQARDRALSIRDEIIEAYETRTAQLEAELEGLRGKLTRQEKES
jgi:gas vesicle protein